MRRGLEKIDEAKGLAWLQNHLDYCTAPLLGEPWVLDMDSTIKPFYGHQEGAEVGYNPHKPGRPSHCYHTYMLSSLRLVLRVDVLPGDEHNVAHATGWPVGVAGSSGAGTAAVRCCAATSRGASSAVMARAEQEGLAYLFRLRMTENVRRSLERAMRQSDWADAGQGWQGKETTLRLVGWSRQRRVILLRRKLGRDPAESPNETDPAQPRAQLHRGRAGPGGLGIRRTGDLAGRRDPDPGAVVSRPSRLRERVRRTEEPMGLGRLHDAGPDALPVARRHGRTDLQLVEPVRPAGRSGPSSRGDHHPAVAAVGDRAAKPNMPAR